MKRVLKIALFALVGCAASVPKLGPVSATGPCNSDQDCKQGEVCLDIGCAVPTQNLVVQVVPPSDSEVATQDFDKVDATKQGAMDFTLGPPGEVHFTASLYPFQANITGTPLHLPDLPYSITPANVAAETRVPVPSGLYQIRATPADPTIPPIQDVARIGSPGASLDLALTFLTHDQVVVVPGTLHAPGPLLSSDLSYSVQVLHTDGTPASQPASTGQDGGGPLDFTLYVAPADPAETLHLAATPKTGVGPSVTFDGNLAALTALASATDGGLSLGDAIPVHASGHVADSSGAPVVGATVRLVATLPGQAKYTSEAATTDANGRYNTTCLHDPSHPDAGGESYQVLVVPPPGSALAMAEVGASVAGWAQGDTPTDFGTAQLPPLSDLTGQVLDATGQPVAGATVQATPAGDNTLPLVSGSTTTEADGTYHLGLTPGTYHFDFTPPLALQAPSASRGPQRVSGASTRLDLQFSAARVVSGHVVDPSGQPVDGALVRVFIVNSASTPPRSTLLARSQVLPDGSFTAVLPAPATHSN